MRALHLRNMRGMMLTMPASPGVTSEPDRMSYLPDRVPERRKWLETMTKFAP